MLSLGMYVSLCVILKERNREDDIRDRILEQVSVNLWNNSCVVSLYSVTLPKKVLLG